MRRLELLNQGAGRGLCVFFFLSACTRLLLLGFVCVYVSLSLGMVCIVRVCVCVVCVVCVCLCVCVCVCVCVFVSFPGVHGM